MNQLPNAPGYYYAKFISPGYTKIDPVHVMHTEQLSGQPFDELRYITGKGLFVAGRLRDFQIHQFEWYGPVPMKEIQS